jgi:hypothetical protein
MLAADDYASYLETLSPELSTWLVISDHTTYTPFGNSNVDGTPVLVYDILVSWIHISPKA